MKIFDYDICEDDKGIIIAESYEQAVEIFKKNYPEIEVVDAYDDFHTCVIREVGDLSGEPELYFIYD